MTQQNSRALYNHTRFTTTKTQIDTGWESGIGAGFSNQHLAGGTNVKNQMCRTDTFEFVGINNKAARIELKHRAKI